MFLCLGAFAGTTLSQNEWTRVETPNFELIGNAGERDIRHAASRLERFRHTLAALFPELKLDGGVRTNVIVFKDTAAYTPYKPRRTDGSVDDAITGYFIAGEDVNYITLAVDRPGAYTTIFHEYVHFLLDVNIGRSDLPPWLNEGIAEYFETLQIRDDGQIIMGTPPAGNLDLLRKEPLIPLKSFLSTENSALHRGGDRSRSLFYAQAWGLTHYLLHFSSNSERGKLSDLMQMMRAKTFGPADLTKMLQMDESQIEAALKTHAARQQNLTKVIVKPPSAGDLAGKITTSRVSDAQSMALLGDLLYRSGRIDEAEGTLRSALSIDDRLAMANMSLGLIRVRQSRLSEARKYLEKAIAADTANYFAHFNYAYALSREYADDDANVSSLPPEVRSRIIASLKRAMELKPEFAESYRLLALINMVDDEDLGAAIELVEKGLTYRPGDGSLKLLLAKIYLRTERYGEAKEIAQRLASAAADENDWNEANRIISTANQYFAAKAAGAAERREGVFGKLPPLILKRSALSDDDVAGIEDDRMIFNLNLLVRPPGFGEKQVVGYIDKVRCSDGDITFVVNTDGETFLLETDTFTEIRMAVLTEGERSFTLDCGVKLSTQLAVMTYSPSIDKKPAIRGRLLSIWFVPNYFRLKTPEEMASRRTVIIEDDRLFEKIKN